MFFSLNQMKGCFPALAHILNVNIMALNPLLLLHGPCSFKLLDIAQIISFCRCLFLSHHCLPSILINLALLQNLDLVMIPLFSPSKP